MKTERRQSMTWPRLTVRLSLLLLPILMVACAVPAPRPSVPPAPIPDRVIIDAVPPPQPEVVPPARPAPPPPPPAPAAPAALTLAAQSDAALAAGDLRLAGLHLERALRIAPRDPELWSRLARVRLEQGDYQQAERMAARSLQLGASSRTLMLTNWRIIARAREALGDTEGARRAWDEVRRLESALG